MKVLKLSLKLFSLLKFLSLLIATGGGGGGGCGRSRGGAEELLSGAGSLCHTQYWFRRNSGPLPLGRAEPFSLGGPLKGSVSDPVSEPALTMETEEDGTNGLSVDPMSDPIFEEYPLIGVDPSNVKGSVICDPLFSASQDNGITLNAGIPGNNFKILH